MTERQTAILGLVTLAAVLAAVWLLFGETGDGARDMRDRPFLPELAQRLNDVAEIRIESPENKVTLARTDTTWRIAEKGGHVADADKVHSLIAGLVRARIVLAKTRNPDLYDRIGLGADAVRLELRDAEGEAMTGLHLGNRLYRERAFHSFVRREGEEATWLVSDIPEVRAEASRWLPRTLLDIARTRIARVLIRHPDGEEIDILRADPEAEFTLAGLGENERLKGFSPLDPIGLAFTGLGLSDARPAEEISANPRLSTVRAETFDGLSLTLALHDTGDETGDAWAMVEASYTEPDAETLAAGVLPDVPSDGAGEAEEINERTAGWAYRLSSADVMALTRRRDGLVEPVPEEEAEEGGDP